MDYYDNETLKQINDNSDLLEYVSQFYDLEKRGNDYFTNCPKHIDNTPSLSFTPEKNAYYCFSCGRSGKMINFLMDYEGLSFKNAVEKAAKISNTDLNSMCQSPTIAFLKNMKSVYNKKKEKTVHEIIDYSKYAIYKRDTVDEWLSEGIKPQIIDLFDVRIDVLHNRIVYPVYESDGKLINIKGRTRYKNFKQLRIPKYINYFPVGTMDYFQGLNITLPYIKQKSEVIIFESIKSVMLAFGWGYKNCVSAEKHTLTNEQVELLADLKVDIVFAYDSDVDYRNGDVWGSIEKLKKIANVFLIKDTRNLLGGFEAKNSPVDCGQAIWEGLYNNKRKVI